MADDEELYFANLDEFVNDEDKIVGYLATQWEGTARSFLEIYADGELFILWLFHFELHTNGWVVRCQFQSTKRNSKHKYNYFPQSFFTINYAFFAVIFFYILLTSTDPYWK